jgi:hypothetical protein
MPTENGTADLRDRPVQIIGGGEGYDQTDCICSINPESCVKTIGKEFKPLNI